MLLILSVSTYVCVYVQVPVPSADHITRLCGNMSGQILVLSIIYLQSDLLKHTDPENKTTSQFVRRIHV